MHASLPPMIRPSTAAAVGTEYQNASWLVQANQSSSKNDCLALRKIKVNHIKSLIFQAFDCKYSYYRPPHHHPQSSMIMKITPVNMQQMN